MLSGKRFDDLLNAIESHCWIRQLETPGAPILDTPELAVSMLVYLKTRDRLLPLDVLELLGIRASEVPGMSKRWWQVPESS